MIKKNDFTFQSLCLVLIITFISYYPSINNGFTSWDDSGYITQNQLLKQSSFTDYFTQHKFIMGNFHPLTMLSYVCEYSIVGIDPKLYHIDNFILHLLNTLFVFWLIFLLGGWQIAALVSVLFGVHPMHVESVAWVSERKDLLYTFFYLASLIAYIKYFNNNRKILYLLSLLLFIFSLLSKAQAVTLPIALLAIDYFYHKKIGWKYLFDKLPFIILSIIFGYIAVIAQRSVHVFTSSTQTINTVATANIGFIKKGVHILFLLYERLCIASYGLLSYVVKMILPTKLSCFYPYPQKVDGMLPFYFYLAPIFLIAILVLTFYKWRNNQAVIFGLVFFIGTIFPVLQLLPVGSSIISDRYTYLPSIGFFFVFACGVFYLVGFEMKEGKIFNTRLKIVLSILVCCVFGYAIAGNQRCKVWKDSETLYSDVLENYPDVYYIQYKLGNEYKVKADSLVIQKQTILAKYFYHKAVDRFEESIKLNNRFARGWYNLSLTYSALGMNQQALNNMDSTISLSPNSSELYRRRSAIYLQLNDKESSKRDEQKAVELKVK